MRKDSAAKKINRVIDANINRAREALRVCEDISRFLLSNRRLSEELKTIRHRISSLSARLPIGKKALLGSRESSADIGRTAGFDRPWKKDIASIYSANIRRSQESLRVLEEFSSVIDGNAQGEFKRLRFKLYTLEKKTIERF